MTVVDTARIYEEMVANIKKLEHLILELMRHPDVTQEQVLRIKNTYAEMWTSHTAVKTRLRKKYPGDKTSKTLPWGK